MSSSMKSLSCALPSQGRPIPLPLKTGASWAASVNKIALTVQIQKKRVFSCSSVCKLTAVLQTDIS